MGTFFGIQTKSASKTSMRVATIYAVIGALWILLSDKVLLFLIGDPGKITRLQTIKGWLFVFASAGIIEWITRRNIVNLRRHDERLREIAQGISVATGDAFFSSLTKHIRNALEADCVIIAEIAKKEDADLSILAAEVSGEADYQCILLASPCMRVLKERRVISIQSGAQQLFPKHECLKKLKVESFIGIPLINASGELLGIMAVVCSEAIKEPEIAEEILPVFAIRAAVEIDRKNADAVLRENEAILAVIFNEAFQLMGLLKPDGTVLKINRRASEFIKSLESEVIGKAFWQTPWWSHSQEEQERLRQAIEAASGGKFIRYEATHKAADGTLVRIDFSLKPIKDAMGNVILLVPEGREID